jgi:hypothetical protein
MTAIAYDLHGHKLGAWNEASGNSNSPALLSRTRQWVELRGSDQSTTGVLHRLSGADTKLGNCPMPPYAHWLGEDRSGQVLNYTENYSDEHDEHKFRIWAYNANTIHLSRNWALPLPSDSSSDYAEISPDGERILFMLESGGQAVYPYPMREFLSVSAANARSPVRWALWTCNSDGTSPHEIGCIRSDEDPGGVIGVAWLPDSKSISFINHGWLHVVAAP